MDPCKSSLDVSGQDSSENQTPVESQESFISGQRDESVEEFPELQSEGDLKVEIKISADPKSQDMEQTESVGSNSIIECSTESGNEPMEIPANSNSETIDSLPVSSKSSNVGEEIKEARVLTSHKRKKSQEIRSNESNSEIIQNPRKLQIHLQMKSPRKIQEPAKC